MRPADLSDVDPLIIEVFRKLPPPGSRWLAADRMAWFATLVCAFRLVYRDRIDFTFNGVEVDAERPWLAIEGFDLALTLEKTGGDHDGN